MKMEDLCLFKDAGLYGVPMGKTKRYAEIAKGNHPLPLKIGGRMMFVIAELREHLAAEIAQARVEAAEEAETHARSNRARAARKHGLRSVG